MPNDEMPITLPEKYRFIVDDEGQLVGEGNNYLVLNTEDGSQAWLSSVTTCETVENSQQANLHQSDTTQRGDKDVSTTYQWNSDETRLFLTLVEKYLNKLENSKYKKKDIFEDISKEMYLQSGRAFNPTMAQCENRYKSLYKKFKDVTDHNNKSGNDHKQWEFYEDMLKLFGKKANITPKAGCSSIKLNDLNSEEHTTSAVSLKEKLNDRLKRKADEGTEVKKKTSKVRSELLEIAKKQESRQEQYHQLEEKKLEILQKQHNDVMNVLNKIADKL